VPENNFSTAQAARRTVRENMILTRLMGRAAGSRHAPRVVLARAIIRETLVDQPIVNLLHYYNLTLNMIKL